MKPRKGAALAFWSYHPNGVLDLRAFHGGCPVIEGTKWMGQQWILGVPFEEAEWSGDNFKASHYDNSWFEHTARRERQMAERAGDWHAQTT